MIHIIEKLENYDPDCILLFEKIKNNIINDGFFIKINYSKPNFILNCIYLQIPLFITSFENNYHCKIQFDIHKNKQILKKIKDIEMEILEKVSIDNKMSVFKIHDQIKNGSIKLFSTTKSENNNEKKSVVSSSSMSSSYPPSSKFLQTFSSSSNRFSQQTSSTITPQNINIMLKISGVWINQKSQN
jgi:hypothetical protein